MSYDDREFITDQGRLTDKDGSFDRMGFREIMRGELWRFMRREVMNMGQSGSEEFRVQQIWQKLLDSKLTRLMHEVEVVELNNEARDAGGVGCDFPQHTVLGAFDIYLEEDSIGLVSIRT